MMNSAGSFHFQSFSFQFNAFQKEKGLKFLRRADEKKSSWFALHIFLPHAIQSFVTIWFQQKLFYAKLQAPRGINSVSIRRLLHETQKTDQHRKLNELKHGKYVNNGVLKTIKLLKLETDKNKWKKWELLKIIKLKLEMQNFGFRALTWWWKFLIHLE